MKYVDGFVVPVPKKNLDAYRRMATLAGAEALALSACAAACALGLARRRTNAGRSPIGCRLPPGGI